MVSAPLRGVVTAAQTAKVASRKVHGTAGKCNLPLDTVPVINGAVTVEPCAAVGGHLVPRKRDGIPVVEKCTVIIGATPAIR